MNLFGKLLAVVCGVTLLAAAGYLGYHAAGFITHAVSSLDHAARAVLLLGTLVALACTQLVATGLKSAKKIETACQEQRDRAEIYWALVEAWCTVRDGLGERSGIRAAQVSVDVSGLESQLLLWASPEVLQSYAAFRAGRPEQDSASWVSLQQVIQEMRKDLGRSTSNLDQTVGELLQYRTKRIFGPASPAQDLHVEVPGARRSRATTNEVDDQWPPAGHAG